MELYDITVIYLATVLAEDKDEATAVVLQDIASGFLEPNDIEVEEK